MRVALLVAAALAIMMLAAAIAVSFGYFPGAIFTPPA
jgi:hypothetical protein